METTEFTQMTQSRRSNDGFRRLRPCAGEESYTTMEPMARNDRAAGPSRLDEVSRRIIEALQADGRASYAAIAKLVGLSEAAVRQRAQRPWTQESCRSSR